MNIQICFLVLFCLNFGCSRCENVPTTTLAVPTINTTALANQTSTQIPWDRIIRGFRCSMKLLNMVVATANVSDAEEYVHVKAQHCRGFTDCRYIIRESMRNRPEDTEEFFSRCDAFIFFDEFNNDCISKFKDQGEINSPVNIGIFQVDETNELMEVPEKQTINKCDGSVLRNPLLRYRIVSVCGVDMWRRFRDNYPTIALMSGC